MAQTLESMITALQRPGFEPSLREALETSNMTPDTAMVERTLDWVRTLRADLIQLLRDVDDDMQAEETLAVNYVELKSRWIAINTKVNYQIFRTGAFDVETALRGTGVSSLLGELEPLLNPEDINAIAQFLAQPVRRAA